MQNTTNFTANDSFFAAANGFSGFRSYFPDVFKSSDYTRIFILKGGPGTGKSSLLRKLCEFGIENDFLLLSIILHLATLFSVVWVLKKEVFEIIKHPFGSLTKKLIT